jgi:hypothetical protein
MVSLCRVLSGLSNIYNPTLQVMTYDAPLRKLLILQTLGLKLHQGQILLYFDLPSVT